jgi:hypothetical protein
MKAYGGWRCITLPFLTSALDGGELLAARSDRFRPGKGSLVPTGEEAEL